MKGVSVTRPLFCTTGKLPCGIMAGLRNKWPCNGFLVETEQEGAADTLRETFDKLQYAWQNEAAAGFFI